MKGRKPQADALKIAKGTRPDRLASASPAAPAGRPECPERFDEPTRAEWDRLCDQLAALGLLSAAHGPALAVYCGAYSRLLAAEACLEERGPLLVRGDGVSEPLVIKSNPAAAMAARCESTMLRVLGELGMTPASAARAKVKAEAPPDRFAEFLSKKARK